MKRKHRKHYRKHYRKQSASLTMWMLLAAIGITLAEKTGRGPAAGIGAAVLVGMLMPIVGTCVSRLWRMLSQSISACQKKKKYRNSSLSVIDRMEGHEFEEYLIVHFEKLGCRCRYVGAGGHDYGVDILVTKNGRTTAVQAKRYRDKVGLKAVQEIISGKQYYKADEALVITNSFFTKPAADIAERCGVKLWDRNDCRKIFKIAEDTEDTEDGNGRKKDYCRKGA